MNTAPQQDTSEQRIWSLLERVPDPEIPVLSIVDLGIVRDVEIEDDAITVALSPTYSACPATELIEVSVKKALTDAGFKATVRRVLSPPWTTDWISEAGRKKLRQFGIAPPAGSSSKRDLLGPRPEVACPRCGSVSTERISEFGSTPCKAVYRCGECLEPFDYFKCI